MNLVVEIFHAYLNPMEVGLRKKGCAAASDCRNESLVHLFPRGRLPTSGEAC